VSVAAIVQRNGLQNANFIWYGQRLAIPGASSPAPVSSSTYYVVQRGDSLSRIAARHGVSLAALARANSITNSNWIYVGQRLTIPSSRSGPSPSAGAAKTHRVQPGEHLALIAARYGTTAAAIAAANGIWNPSLIYSGQLLTIPGGGGSSPPAPSGGGLSFVVYISQQHCYLYRDGVQLYSWACSTGRSGAGTLSGTFHVQSKIRNAWGSRFNAWMPFWLGIYWAGSSENGIHGLPVNASTGATVWANLVGTPITFGCVMLDNQAATTLYNLAYIGMPVIIRP
jgi:LysM repeat protein